MEEGRGWGRRKKKQWEENRREGKNERNRKETTLKHEKTIIK